MFKYDQKKDKINSKRCQSNVFKGWRRKVLLSFSPTYGKYLKSTYFNDIFYWIL